MGKKRNRYGFLYLRINKKRCHTNSQNTRKSCTGNISGSINAMLIGIDGNEANTTKRVGIGRYAFELVKQFAGFPLSETRFQVYLKDRPLEDMPKVSENWQYKIVKPRKLWTQVGLPVSLYRQKPQPNIFFSPSHYAPRFSPMPLAISIMDLSYIHYPELFAKKDL